jgi:hypothetical protein
MTIREKGYYPWDGKLKSGGISWLPILFKGIKTAFRKKFAKAVFAFATMPFAIFLLAVYVSTKPELKMLSRLVSLLRDDAAFFNAFYTNGFLIFVMLVFCIFIGAELISGDLQFNAFPLYFSRPLNRLDYIWGKFSIIMFYFLLFTLIPGILLIIFKMIFTGAFAVEPKLLLAIIFTPLVVSFFLASLTLMISSLSSNGKFVKIAIFLVFIFSNGIAEILKGIFKSSYFLLFSIQVNIQQTGSYFFATKPAFSFPPGLSFLVILILSSMMMVVLYLKVTKLEAQIEASG